MVIGSNFRKILNVSIILLILLVITLIVTYSPYYDGFEAGLYYLSPDLSENRTVLRDSVILNKPVIVKIVFERKDNFGSYEYSDFNDFIMNLELQIWNDAEYLSFDERRLDFFDINEDRIEFTIGELKGTGAYFIYINSDFAVNPYYHIGIGIGKETKFVPLGHNIRNFY